MTTNTPKTIDAQFALVSLDLIAMSKTNPRRTFDADSLKELTESVKLHGVLQPILLRHSGKPPMLELVAGERRYRAAKAAGLKAVPARVVILTDAEACEAQIIENLHRDDVAPLDEGLGYRQLLDLQADGKPVHTIDSLAARVAKSTSYVYQRLKLADLIPDAQKAMSGGLTAGHAILIARLTPAQQAKVLADYWREDHWGDMPSVRDLRQHIDRDISRKLSAAPWKLTDGTFPMRPACSACPKNSDVTPALYPDVDKKGGPQCGNGECYEAKMNVHLSRAHVALKKTAPEALQISRSFQLAPAAQKENPSVVAANRYEEVKPNAKGAVPALVVDGHDRGKQVYVLPKKAGPTTKAPERSLADRKAELQREIDAATRRQALFELSKVAKVDLLMRDIAIYCISGMSAPEELLGPRFLDQFGPEKIGKALDALVAEKAAKLAKRNLPDPCIVAIVAGLFEHATHTHDNGRGPALLAAAKAAGVDLKACEKAAREEPKLADKIKRLADAERFDGKAKKQAKPAPPAKAKGKRSAAAR